MCIENALKLIKKYLEIHEMSGEIEYRDGEFLIYLDFGIYDEEEIENELMTLLEYVIDDNFTLTIMIIDDLAF